MVELPRHLLNGAKVQAHCPSGSMEWLFHRPFSPQSTAMRVHVAHFVEEVLHGRGRISIAAAQRYLVREAMAGRMHWKMPPPRLFASWAQSAVDRHRIP